MPLESMAFATFYEFAMSAKCAGDNTKRQWTYRLLLVAATDSIQFVVDLKPHHLAALSY